jgi:hypothetical protein
MKFFGLRHAVPAIIGIALLSSCSGNSHSSGMLPGTPVSGHAVSGIPLPPSGAALAALHPAQLTLSPMVSQIALPSISAAMRGGPSGVSPNSSNPGDAEVVGTVIYGGGPYTGMYTENTAYSADEFPLSYPVGATGSQELFSVLTRPPQGGCYSPSTVALNTGTQAYMFFVVFDYCGASPTAALAAQIDANFKKYYVAPNSDDLPVYKTLVFTTDATAGPTSRWYLLLWNYVTAQYDVALQRTGQSTTTFGYSVWESLYRPGLCSNGLAPSASDNMTLLNSSTHTYDTVAPTMTGTTSVTIPSGTLACFNTDITGMWTNAFYPDPYFIGIPETNFWMVRSRNMRDSSCTQSGVIRGYYPCDLQNAYKLPVANGSGKTIAIVDAFNDPNAEADMAVYRTQFGLPACTTANLCFKKVNQQGLAAPLPANDAGWAGEISLDLDMASATCPKCKIILVEASSATSANLGISVDEAVTLGANVVSNSYGTNGPEQDDTAFDVHYNHPGVAVVASSGDSGFGAQYPAASQYVIAAGGTSLFTAGNARGALELAWNGAGSGCSMFEVKPAWQTDSGCTMRMIADVSAVADPYTGVAVYQTYGGSGWTIYGGTSVASPVIAGSIALATPTHNYAQDLYLNPSQFFDITDGNNDNGTCFGAPLYYCNAGVAYDGPTGLGTPNGITGFNALPQGSPQSLTSAGPIRDVRSSLQHGHTQRACADVARGYMRCDAIRLVL